MVEIIKDIKIKVHKGECLSFSNENGKNIELDKCTIITTEETFNFGTCILSTTDERLNSGVKWLTQKKHLKKFIGAKIKEQSTSVGDMGFLHLDTNKGNLSVGY